MEDKENDDGLIEKSELPSSSPTTTTTTTTTTDNAIDQSNNDNDNDVTKITKDDEDVDVADDGDNNEKNQQHQYGGEESTIVHHSSPPHSNKRNSPLPSPPHSYNSSPKMNISYNASPGIGHRNKSDHENSGTSDDNEDHGDDDTVDKKSKKKKKKEKKKKKQQAREKGGDDNIYHPEHGATDEDNNSSNTDGETDDEERKNLKKEKKKKKKEEKKAKKEQKRLNQLEIDKQFQLQQPIFIPSPPQYSKSPPSQSYPTSPTSDNNNMTKSKVGQLFDFDPNTTTTTVGGMNAAPEHQHPPLLPPPPTKIIKKKKKKGDKDDEGKKKKKKSESEKMPSLGPSATFIGQLSSLTKRNNLPPFNNSSDKGKSINNNDFPSDGTKKQQKKQPNGKGDVSIDIDKPQKIQVWRKVLSDDSKLFSNERTWMSWVGLTFSLGAIGTSIITFFGTQNVALFTGVSLWVIALGFLLYSYVIFRLRRRAILKKVRGPFYDPYGPIALVCTTMLSVSIFLVFFIIKRPPPMVSTTSS